MIGREVADMAEGSDVRMPTCFFAIGRKSFLQSR